jgi:hypothetical protein
VGGSDTTPTATAPPASPQRDARRAAYNRAQIEYNANGRDFMSELYDVVLSAKPTRGTRKAIGLKHVVR